MRYYKFILITLIICTDGFAQYRATSPINNSIQINQNSNNTDYNWSEQVNEINSRQSRGLNRYHKQYKTAFSCDISYGLITFYGDLQGYQTDVPNQSNINIAINKRWTPRSSGKLFMSLGNYADIGINDNPQPYTDGLNTTYNANDFFNSEVTGKYALIGFTSRTKIGFTKLKNINNEKKFGVFFNIGLGYMSSSVLLRKKTDYSIKISRYIQSLVFPIGFETSYMIKGNLGIQIAYDYYLIANENMDLMNSSQSELDYLTNFKTGVFFKIN
jgi:hypothetical protein